MLKKADDLVSGTSKFPILTTRGRRVLLTALVMVVSLFCAVAWYAPEILLRASVDLWAVSDKVERADAVAVFGGGLATRPFAAAAYYRAGLVPEVLVSNIPPQPIIRDVVHYETKQNRDELINNGVPAEAIELLGENLKSTYEEAVALRSWALRNHAHSIIVPTEYFPSRRVRWILKHEFYGTGVRILVPALDTPQYSRRDWWKNQGAIDEFKSEIVKNIYYRLVYGIL